MKHIFTFIIGLLCCTQLSFGQSVPQGMKYQAVARDLKGQVMANSYLQLKVSLYSDPVSRDIAYTEIHKVTTSELGLFSLSIGEGFAFKGSFDAIPWSTADIWMEVAIQADDETEFITISDSRMLSVPYAFHAATASELTGKGNEAKGPSDPAGPEVDWQLLGNKATNPGKHRLGTTDMADLVVVTNDIERLRILSNGDVLMQNNLFAQQAVFLNTLGGKTVNYGDFSVGGNAFAQKQLSVDGRTYLGDQLKVEGATFIENTLEVELNQVILDDTESTSDATGALVVTGGTGIGRNLNVGGDVNFGGNLNAGGNVYIVGELGVQGDVSLEEELAVGGNVHFEKDLSVDQNVHIEGNLSVDGDVNFEGATDFNGPVRLTDLTESTNSSTGALIVDGGVGIGKNLNIAGALGVRGTSDGFVASIQNTNESNGDGLEIKLGKTHPGWDGGAYINVTNPGAEFLDGNIQTVRGWIEGEPFEYSQLLTFVQPAVIAGTTCGLVEKLSEQLNGALGLPKGVPPLTDEIIFDAMNNLLGDFLNDDWAPDNPTTLIPGFRLEFPTDFCGDYLPSFTMPNINFVDVTNSLTNDNQFISFKDKENRELGSIRAMSVTEWGNDYFDGTFLVNFIGNTVSLDPLDILLSCYKEFTSLADDYNHIGVEYASGHGDYAEWLERVDASEIISRGDIVAVKGGKITKDLTGAEQVMAVSAYPIVLGNLPEEKDAHLGNNVAFMGQIPVKVMGPVNTGDYIIANQEIPGYGIAKAQGDLTIEDMPLVVGRSWETKAGAGSKMVNTVVGVHNGDYFRILKNYEQKLSEAEARIALISSESTTRMQSLEARVDLLMERMEVSGNKLAIQK